MTAGGGWSISTVRATVADLHARDLPEVLTRTVEICEPVDAALVLGSTQDVSVVDVDALRARHLSVVRRRSGGGAVLVEPGGLIWIDVLIPRGDPRWNDDVGKSVEWLGWVCHDALANCGVVTGPPCEVMQRTRWSSLVCFAGLGPGELTIDGAKVMGISQRRTRVGARFSLSVPLRWDPVGTAELFALTPGDQVELAGELVRSARAVDVPEEVLLSALLAAFRNI